MHCSKPNIIRILAIFLFSFITISAHAQQIAYDNALENGWQNWSWGSTTNLSNTSPVHSGGDSIAVTYTAAYGGLYLHNTAFNSAPYGAISFWINGGTTGGQQLQVAGTLSGAYQNTYSIGTVPNDGLWHQYTVPLAAIGVANSSNMDGFFIQESSGRATVPTMYVDDISLTSAAPPNPISVNVNAASVIRSASPRWIGLNSVMWDASVGDTPTQNLLGAAHFGVIRWPGGSDSDAYNWSINRNDGDTWTWESGSGAYVSLLLGSGATGIITTNYGSGTPKMAAAWVAYFDGSPGSTQVIGTDAKGVNWQTVGYWASIRAAAPLATDDGYNFLRINHASPLGINLFEIGNEEYGSWENDQHGVSGSDLLGSPHDAVTYAEYSEQFITAMKAVDPSIKVGCVTIPGEQYPQTESVVNPVNGKTYTDWTSVLLSTLANSSTNPTGIMPDFIIDHRYPLAPGSETDAGLLASTTGWPADATDLRNQLNNYLGSRSANIEIDATETNDVYSTPGKQSVSLVNGLYTADSIGMVSQTEINELNWWDLRNGSDETDGLDVSSTLYGWRNYGDYGLISSASSPDGAYVPYPPYYGFKLASHYAQAGGQVVSATSGYGLLTAYSALEPDGSLALMVINKSATYPMTASISLSGFTAGTTAVVYSYGEGNDTANADLTTNSLSGITLPYSYTFPVYSMTVIDFQPALNAPSGLTATAGQNQVSLFWTAPGGLKPTGYNVYDSTTAGGPYTKVQSNVSGTTATVTGLAAGTQYYFVVASVNGSQTSVYSNQATATPTGASPAAPTGLTAIAQQGQIALSWTAPTGTPAATGYNVYRSTTSGSGYARIASNIALPSYPDTSVTGGTLYYYVVTALNSTVEGPDSNQASATAKYLPPNSSTGLTATLGNAQVSLTWTAPTGTVTATGYNVYRSTTSGGPYTVLQSNVSSTSATDTSVTNGTAYYYVVTALNHTAESAYSNQANGTPNWTVPGVPTGLTALPGDTTASLSWTAPGGTVTVTGYNIYRSTTSGGPYVIDLSNVSTTSATDSGLIDGTTYYYVVTALNHTAESAQSAPASATPEYTAPGAPTSLTATAGIAQVALSWTAPVGITPTAYVVQRSTVTGGPYTVLSSTVTTTTYTDTTAVSGTKYFYVVAALNVTTQGPNSNEVSATPTYPAPNAPSGLTATVSGAFIGLSWAAPGGTVIPTGYNVYRSTTTGGPYTLILSGLTVTSTSDGTVTNGTTYYYVVTALNHTAQSGYSNQASATPQSLLPGAPTNLAATPGNALVTLTWTAATGTVKSYTVYRSTTNGGPYTSVKTGLTTTSYSNTGLTNGTTYYYVVAAVNTNGTGPYSNQASATPAPPVPLAPTNLTAVAGNATVALTWTKPSNTSPTSYSLYRGTTSGGPYSLVKTTTSNVGTTDSTVTNGTTYYYVLTASDASGTSPDSNEASATPELPIPTAPTALKSTAGNATVSLSWTKPSNVTPTSYGVYRGTTSGGPYTLVKTVTGTATSDATVTNGTTYYYVVNAVNGSGTSPNSNEASATPTLPIPTAPTNLKATGTSGQVALTWTKPSNVTPASYNVQRATVSGGPYTTIATPASTSYKDTSVTNGTAYYYVVSATNTSGTSPNSGEASATP